MPPENTALEERLGVRCSKEDKEAIDNAAAASNRSTSDYIRLVMLAAVKEGTKV